MKKNFYEQLKEELKEIQKEGKIEDIIIEEVHDDYEEEVVETNIPIQRKMKSVNLKKGLAAAMLALTISSTGLSTMPNIVTNNTATTVEAASKKKDNKKPKFTFKGKTKMTVTKGKSVKIPKVTAKDNKDGNVTKKIKVTVKKGKKSYSSIAKKIKANKSVKFTGTGKYTITYTVTDKAGNKATKKRYITVKDDSKTKKATTETQTTEVPTTEKTTTESVTTETPTTETPTTETPTTEIAPEADLSEYGTLETATVDGNVYKFITNPTEKYRDVRYGNLGTGSKTLKFERWSIALFEYDSTKVDYYQNHKYLEFMGKIDVIDNYGVDCSNNIFIVEEKINDNNRFIVICFVDSKNNCYVLKIISLQNFYQTKVNSEDYEWSYVNDELGVCFIGTYSNNLSNNNAKYLTLKNNFTSNKKF